MMRQVTCDGCGNAFMRTVKQVNAVIRKSGKWGCRSCSNRVRNLARARPLGSTRTSAGGYIFEKTENGWVQQHRIVMAKKLGRTLLETEMVHHIDENKTNNDPSNLEVETWGRHTANHHTGAKRTGVALENIRRGIARRSTTRLNTQLVEEIKVAVQAGRTQLSIALELKVSPMTISRAVRGESFKQ